MCGIFGYTGSDRATRILCRGLKISSTEDMILGGSPLYRAGLVIRKDAGKINVSFLRSKGI